MRLTKLSASLTTTGLPLAGRQSAKGTVTFANR
jgi:hypothetical protein